MTVKLRRVELKLPNSIKTKHTKFDVFKGRFGNIIYSPVKPNPFKNSKFIKDHKFNGDRTGFVNAGVNDNEL